jgi:hypothetical protein
MSQSKGSFQAIRPSLRTEERKHRRECDDLSYSTASSTAQLVQIASYVVDGPVLRLFSSSSEDADTRNTEDTVDGSMIKRRVAVTVYDGSETDSSRSRTSESATQSSTNSIWSEKARADSGSIISPPNQLKREVNSKNQVLHQTIADPEISIFGRMFSCFNPESQNEIDVEYLGHSNASPGEGDALDGVFGAVEGFVCTETTSLDRHKRELLAREFEKNHPKDILDNVFEGVGNSMCADDIIQEQRMQSSSSRLTSERRMRDMAYNKARALTKYEGDMLDNVFDGVEKVACNEHVRYDRYDSDMPVNEDMLDRVFEGIEGVACRDDHDSLHGRERTTPSMRGQDPPGKSKKKSLAVVKQDNDTLDYVCGSFERAMGLGEVKFTHAKKPDVLDSVCEYMEFAVCRDSARTGGSDSPIDLTTVSGFSLGKHNSIVDPMRDFAERERREALQKMRERGRPAVKVKSHDRDVIDRDVIDRVFENSESKICHHDQYRGVRDKLKGFKKTKPARREGAVKKRNVYDLKAGE